MYDYPLFSRGGPGRLSLPAEPGPSGPLRRPMVRKPPANTPGWNAAGYHHPVLQAEGGESGDPFMPALDSIAQHNALAPGPPCTMEKAFVAYFDDMYIETPELHVKMSIVCRAQRAPCGRAKTRVWTAEKQSLEQAIHL